MGSIETKILIVDDDEQILKTTTLMLSRLGYETISASNGEKGLLKYLQNHCDIVLTDYEMSGMNGLELAGRIKRINHGTKVIMMTGHSKEWIVGQITCDSIDWIMSKPLKLNTLKNILQEVQTTLEVA